MAQGDKSKYTDKQKRMAEHIEQSYEERGVTNEEAERRAWSTVNAEHGGGKKPGGSGRGKKENHEPARKRREKATNERSQAERSAAAKKGWETRRKSGA